MTTDRFTLAALRRAPRLAFPPAALALLGGEAQASDSALLNVVSHNAVGASLVMGMAVFALTTALLHLRAGKVWREKNAKLHGELAATQAANERINAVAAADHQLIISWAGPDEAPLIEGSWDFSQASQPLAFGAWAKPADAAALQRGVDALKARGEGFTLTAATKSEGLVEAEGRAVAGRAVLLLRDVSGLRSKTLILERSCAALTAERDAFKSLLDALPHPVWTRSKDGVLSWVNAAFVRSVEARDALEVEARGLELLDREEREQAAAARREGRIFAAKTPAIVAGERRTFDVVEAPAAGGSAGIAVDVSAREQAQNELKNQMQAHVQTLDKIATAVAIFDEKQRLFFHNTAFEKLWSLTPAELEGGPTIGEILDRLRANRRLNEDGDFRAWKGEVLKAFISLTPVEDWWHLPDGRMLHMVATPSPQGGVTYLFNDVTERRSLEFKVNALSRMQSETLDGLHEGVAVFGSDGRLKLFNPAFAAAWKLAPAMLGDNPHIDEIIGLCRPLFPDEEMWADLRSIIAGVRDARDDFSCRMFRLDGSVKDVTATPLPDGATLVAFANVTDSVNVERALKEKNEALENAARLRDDFVHHVSYELRSPLTNIIGFAQLLGDGIAGPLTERQKDYTSHILRSSGSLLVIINDILDLASIDNGTVTLDMGDVDVAATVDEAVQGLADRFASSQVALKIDIASDLGPLKADARRLRQVVYNLLSNAVGFSSPGQSVTISARRDRDEAVIAVVDQGQGIPPEVLERVFERFESHAAGSDHRGVGLGLAIVRSFIELHGGRVEIESKLGAGTCVTCRLPIAGMAIPRAAE